MERMWTICYPERILERTIIYIGLLFILTLEYDFVLTERNMASNF